MLTGVSSAPMTTLVPQFVALYLKLATMPEGSEIPAPHAVVDPVLMMLANAVAVLPTCTERLLGNTDDTRLVGAGEASGAHTVPENVTEKLSKRANASCEPRRSAHP